MMVMQNSVLRNIEIFGIANVSANKSCIFLNSGILWFLNRLQPYLWHFSICLKTDFCYIISDARRIDWYMYCRHKSKNFFIFFTFMCYSMKVLIFIPLWVDIFNFLLNDILYVLLHACTWRQGIYPPLILSFKQETRKESGKGI